MLVVDEAAGALALLEDYLTKAGFWQAEGVVADLYLGFRLAESLRRESSPPPPEPCPLPALCCRIRPSAEPRPAPGGYSLGGWERSWDDAGYAAAIDSVREAIRRGAVYQVNLVQHLSAPFSGDPAGARRRARSAPPARTAPVRGARLRDRLGLPRALPRPPRRAADDRADQRHRAAGQSVAGEKDEAEHIMIVDLERNDLARVCLPGSIRWPNCLSSEARRCQPPRVAGRGAARVRGDARAILEATFPGGSIPGRRRSRRST